VARRPISHILKKIHCVRQMTVSFLAAVCAVSALTFQSVYLICGHYGRIILWSTAQESIYFKNAGPWLL